MKKLLLILLSALVFLGFAQTSQAALFNFDPGTPAGTYSPTFGNFPAWYQDGTGGNPPTIAGTQLELCLSQTPSPTGLGPMCVLLADPGFNPALPLIFDTNFPSESFYMIADANPALAGGRLTYRASLEAAFATGGVAPGQQITFSRIRVRADLPNGSPTGCNYTFIHPYGVETIAVAATGTRAINLVRDIGVGAPGVFSGALAGDIGPWLVRTGGPFPANAAGEIFIGDPNVLTTVTGSPFGTDFVRLVDCKNNVVATTDQFNLAGQIFNRLPPVPLTVSRSTYSRTAAGVTKIDVFATSSAGATLTFTDDNVPATADQVMTTDGAVNFYGQSAPAAPPAHVLVKSTAATFSPTTLASNVLDVVKITTATYALDTKNLIIEATSSDEGTLPALTALGWGNLSVALPGTTTQSLVVLAVPEPPAFVTVDSSWGGKDTEPVKVVPTFNVPPVAVNDAVATPQGVPIIINVLANDKDPDSTVTPPVLTVDPTSLSAIPPLAGSITLNPDQTITYNPDGAFIGPTVSFTYKAVDSLGALSNTATVTVTINLPPIANADTATTSAGVPVTINVLANDTDPGGHLPLSVASVSPSSANGGAVAIAPTGTAVIYTPPAGFPPAGTPSATDTFTYFAADSIGVVSAAPATVTVTVTAANLAPVAVDDLATTNQGVAVAINVLANDTDPDGPPPLTVVNLGAVTPAGAGTVAVNAVTQAVTFTPAATFFGTATFTYQAQDGALALSNVATVTVTVNARPVAVNDAAATNQGVAVAINVIANDTPLASLVPGSIAVVTAPLNGTLLLNNPLAGSITYNPNPAFAGPTDTFTYTVTDTLGQVSNAATVTVTVNAAPVAVNDAATTATCAAAPCAPLTINVLANDTDPNRTAGGLTVATFTQPAAGGTVALNATSTAVTFTPAVGFAGAATFTYTAKDALGALSLPATVTVNVGGTITIKTAQYDVRKAAWNLNGSVPRGPAVTLDLLLVRGGTVIGTIGRVTTAVNSGSWQFKGASTNVPPSPAAIAGDVLRVVTVSAPAGITVQQALQVK